MTISDREICTKCKMPKFARGSGSMTEWITCCRCDVVAPSETQKESVKLCIKCGKRMNQGRVGSFTHYIFRFDICSCDVPEHMKPAIDADQLQQSSLVTESITDGEAELKVDGNRFPRERYKPLEVIGQGAAGTVYYCLDRILNKRVTVKTLHVQTPEQLVAFHNEARVLSKLEHPNIVRILNFGATESGAPYMVLEYTSGKSLDQFLKDNGPLHWSSALAIFIRLAAALEYCHEHRVFHRDLKPSNILLTSVGEQSTIKLFDFGVAAVQSTSAESQFVTIAGTPAYMAPDQAHGKDFDARSEIYSFACVLFETLSGRPPFEAESPLELLSMHANAAPPLVSDLIDSDIPSDLVSTISKCLEKLPENRYQSGRELVDVLSLIQTCQTKAISEHQTQTGTITGFYKQPEGVGRHLQNLWTDLPLAAKALQVTALIIVLAFTALTIKQYATGDSAIVSKEGDFIDPTDVSNVYSSNIVIEGGDIAVRPSFSDDDMKTLVALRDRKHLNLSNSQITSKQCSYLRKLKDLEELDISNTRIDDEALESVGKLSKLKTLRLDGTNIGDTGIQELVPLKDLTALSISDTLITDEGVRAIGQMPSLTSLNLDGCEKLTDGALDYLMDCNLNILQIWDCPWISQDAADNFKTAHPKCVVSFKGKVREGGPEFEAKTDTAYIKMLERGKRRKKYYNAELNALGYKYYKDMRNSEFRDFFQRPDAFAERTNFSNIKNQRVVECLKDPQFKKIMQEEIAQKYWRSYDFWEKLETVNETFDKYTNVGE